MCVVLHASDAGDTNTLASHFASAKSNLDFEKQIGQYHNQGIYGSDQLFSCVSNVQMPQFLFEVDCQVLHIIQKFTSGPILTASTMSHYKFLSPICLISDQACSFQSIA